MIGQNRVNAHLYPALLFFLLCLKFDNDVMIQPGRAAHLWNGPSLCGHKWRNGDKIKNGFQNKTQDKLADGVCKYKSTLIDKGLNYFISVKLLILKTIVSPASVVQDSTAWNSLFKCIKIQCKQSFLTRRWFRLLLLHINLFVTKTSGRRILALFEKLQ